MGEAAVIANKTRATVNSLYDAYARGDRDRVSSLIHDDIDWIIHGPVHVFPFQGPRQGKAQVLDTLAAIGEEFALMHYRPGIVIVEDDRAAVLSDAAFMQRSTNRIVRLRLVNFLRVQDGQVIEFREFSDTFDAVEQVLGTSIAVGTPGRVLRS